MLLDWYQNIYDMSSEKTTVAILFGGKSPEHAISLLSARSVIDNIDGQRFAKVLIGIDTSGVWRHYGPTIQFENEGSPLHVSLPAGGEVIELSQSHGVKTIVDSAGQVVAEVDVIFPVLHGLYGEDGSVQGLAHLAGLPCVGCGILGSAVCMDKDVAKRLLRDAGIAVADFVTLRQGYNDQLTYGEVKAKLGPELYIKPVNLGSSVGVSFVDNEADYQTAVAEAFRYDMKVIVEEKVTGREIECAVLGNESPVASAIGEIAPTAEFYTFESKYVDKDDAKLSIPAQIPKAVADRARALAVETFVLLECLGFARVDMFLTVDERLIVNEVNTIPGFTSISMYPKLWEYSGLPYTDLLSKLIDLAMDRERATALLLG